ncbi:MAG: recombination protein O N-terminal domain-containing protein [Patescibacteria group bacterium]
MSYHIYHTKGIVLGSAPSGEASRHHLIFTRELGLVWAKAQAVRTMRSKLRHSLTDYTFGEFSLVRGKDIWRVTSARMHSNHYIDFGHAKDVRDTLVRITALLKRLLHGEERHDVLFDTVESAIAFSQRHSFSTVSLAQFESITVLRILHLLGYVGASPELSAFVQSDEWTPELLTSFGVYSRQAIAMINQSLKESQL